MYFDIFDTESPRIIMEMHAETKRADPHSKADPPPPNDPIVGLKKLQFVIGGRTPLSRQTQ
jgi:hypothetical protein